MMTSSSTVRCLQTPARAVRHMQVAVLCRSRRSVKRSTELLQIVPDLVEIFREAEPQRTVRRQRPLHRMLLPRARNLLDISRSCPRVRTAAGCSTIAGTLQKSSLQSDPTDASRSKMAAVDRDRGQQEADRCKHFGERTAVSSPSLPDATARYPLSVLLADLQRNSDFVSVTGDRVQALVEELDRRKRGGGPVPESVSGLDLEHLLGLRSQSGRRKFLHFLLRKERGKTRRAEERAARRADREATERPEPTVRNTIVRWGQSQAEDALNAWTAARSLLLGPPLVFDLSFDALMSRQELINTVLQLGLSLKINKTLGEPFHVHLTSLAPDGGTERELRRVHGRQYDRLMASVTDKPPQGVFPPRQLVYLSADSPNVLRGFDPDRVYVVGGFVDRCVQGGASLGRAESAGLAHARLPLDEHLRWSSGTKNLTLDQMLCILSEVRASGDWGRALEHVPRRKHLGRRTSTPLD